MLKSKSKIHPSYLNRLCQVPYDFFTYIKETETLVAELADFEGNGYRGKAVYGDALDVGFLVNGMHQQILFTLSRVENVGSELKYVEYTSSSDDSETTFTVRLYND